VGPLSGLRFSACLKSDAGHKGEKTQNKIPNNFAPTKNAYVKMIEAKIILPLNYFALIFSCDKRGRLNSHNFSFSTILSIFTSPFTFD